MGRSSGWLAVGLQVGGAFPADSRPDGPRGRAARHSEETTKYRRRYPKFENRKPRGRRIDEETHDEARDASHHCGTECTNRRPPQNQRQRTQTRHRRNRTSTPTGSAHRREQRGRSEPSIWKPPPSASSTAKNEQTGDGTHLRQRLGERRLSQWSGDAEQVARRSSVAVLRCSWLPRAAAVLVTPPRQPPPRRVPRRQAR